MARSKGKPQNNNGATVGYEAELWRMGGALRLSQADRGYQRQNQIVGHQSHWIWSIPQYQELH
jgi:hypothetical protein